jgi:hypothetical protein
VNSSPDASHSQRVKACVLSSLSSPRLIARRHGGRSGHEMPPTFLGWILPPDHSTRHIPHHGACYAAMQRALSLTLPKIRATVHRSNSSQSSRHRRKPSRHRQGGCPKLSMNDHINHSWHRSDGGNRRGCRLRHGYGHPAVRGGRTDVPRASAGLVAER